MTRGISAARSSSTDTRQACIPCYLKGESELYHTRLLGDLSEDGLLRIKPKLAGSGSQRSMLSEMHLSSVRKAEGRLKTWQRNTSRITKGAI